MVSTLTGVNTALTQPHLPVVWYKSQVLFSITICKSQTETNFWALYWDKGYGSDLIRVRSVRPVLGRPVWTVRPILLDPLWTVAPKMWGSVGHLSWGWMRGIYSWAPRTWRVERWKARVAIVEVFGVVRRWPGPPVTTTTVVVRVNLKPSFTVIAIMLVVLSWVTSEIQHYFVVLHTWKH